VLAGFLTSLSKHVLVLIDEDYYEGVDEPGYPNGVAWVKRFPNLIVTRTFSKIHGLAGLRICMNYPANNLHINYSTSGIDGKPHFNYQDAQQNLSLSYRGM
jgi:histidinol-phosphate/aromatic aminotransferase/cobyric acid decarboxylase-like protein